MKQDLFLKLDPDAKGIDFQGEWTLAQLSDIKTELKKTTWPASGKFRMNGSAVSKMDSAGAWILLKEKTALESKGIQVQLSGFPEQMNKLLDYVAKKMEGLSTLPKKKTRFWIARLGRDTIKQVQETLSYLSFVGKLSLEGLALFFNPRQFRFNSVVNTIDTTGFRALGIIALLSFMIGVVIAYQMGFQLRNYGANVFIVDLLGLSILREFGPLLSAIMVAGRTGSSFTAQLGIMKINQEIDALDTMGVTPGQLLLIPRLIGLFIALPLLTVWADIWGIIGGMLMANNMLGVTPYDFLERFEREIPVRALIIGIGKAPIFALIIASIGCYEGMKVEGSAESVGAKTTRSVVLGIFLIILADAFFSILFSKLRL